MQFLVIPLELSGVYCSTCVEALDAVLEMCSHDMNVLSVYMSTSSSKGSLSYLALQFPHTKMTLFLFNKCLLKKSK